MSILSTMRSSASALLAERLRMDVISNNVANINSTRTATGGPYKRLQPVFQPDRANKNSFSARFASFFGRAEMPRGVLVNQIKEDATQGKLVYDPNHPDADAAGFVEFPNVDIVQEMTDMMGATRAYEANVTVMNAAKAMAMKALDI